MKLFLDSFQNQDTSGDCQKRTCPIYWEHNGMVYPHERWSDYCIIVLEWWTVRLKEIMEGVEKVDLPFMDGPYRISVNRVELTGVELTTRQGELFATTSIAELVQEVLRGLETTIEAVIIDSGSDDCVKSLSACIEMLKSSSPHTFE